MSATVRVDLAVIGAGPAGATLAALAASRGADVALVDRDVFPRDKLCGEFLSYDALPVLAAVGALEEIDAAGARRIESCRIVGARKTVEFAFPQPARGISRLLLDDILLRLAARRGARRFDGWNVISLDCTGRRLVVERDGEQREIVARAIAGAWGRWGRFDAQLQRPFVHEREERSFGFKRHYVSASLRDRGENVIELHPFRHGYLGANGVEGGVTNVCGLVHAGRLAGHKGRWESFVESLRRERPRLDELFAELAPAQEGFLSSDPVIFRPRSAVEQGMLLVGDASGVIDPLTGNGMAMAVQSALIAAPLLLRIAAGEDAPSLEQRYREEHAAFFSKRIAWSRAAARILPHPGLVDAAVRLLPASLGRLFLARTRASVAEVEARMAALG